MKFTKIVFALFIFSSLFLASCDKEEDLNFDLKFENIAVTVPAMGGPFNEYKTFASEVITTGIEAELNKYGASLNDIESANLKDLTVNITAPSGRNFDAVLFLESFASATGLSDTKIGFTEGDLDGKTSVTFTTNFSDLAPFIKKESFGFLVRGYIDEAIATPTTLDIDFIVTVKAKVKK